MITIENLSKQFTTAKGINVLALDDINLTIPQGEIFGIIGNSGAGKSTLLRSINLLERPDQGHIKINGIDLMALSESSLREQRKKIAMIFQHFNLINNKTVYENIALPLRLNGNFEAKQHRIDELLQLVELSDKADAYPSQLSGGQKQRVAIARALVSEPDLLLCDEATSALDPNTTAEVLALLQKINQSMQLTIVLISHEMEVVRHICHRFAQMQAGKIVQVDRVLSVFENHVTDHLLLDGLKPKLPPALAHKITPSPAPGKFPLCQLMFLGDISNQAIISQVSQEFAIEINILLANIDVIQQQTFGILIIQIHGEDSQLQHVYEVFRQQDIGLEVLGYVE